MSLTHQIHETTRTLEIFFPGNLLSSNVDPMRQELDVLLGTSSFETCRLNLAKAEMIDSSGLNLLVEICRQVGGKSAKLEAVIAGPKIRRLFGFVRLDRKMALLENAA